jgi:hypothetical protein
LGAIAITHWYSPLEIGNKEKKEEREKGRL